MINWWIRRKNNGWKQNGFEYILMADDYEIAIFKDVDEAVLFRDEFDIKIDMRVR